MKEIFELYAKYNITTNQAMYAILAHISPDLLLKDSGSFYKSILGILNHLVFADITWLKRFIHFFPGLLKPNLSLPDVNIPSTFEVILTSFSEIITIRNVIDNQIIKMVDLLQDADYTTNLSYKNSRGDQINKIAWQMVLHMFNHQTHHRGAIAVILDQLKIDNDYSNLITIKPGTA
jgi:uncharacterized damage-inducible protein DinB